MEQQTFFDDDFQPPPSGPSWQWHDAWPDGLTHRQYLIMQIARDMRALDEELDDDMKAFFAERIAAYQDAAKGSCPSLPERSGQAGQ